MDGKRLMLNEMVIGGQEETKKGPWKAEEDEVLINHVNKYGPRDWSSIQSKGLLQRTGKSCRLRWVNKLRPNLKNGVKFSPEEERTVIELQAEFGNKWARIATYLPGRTDNDVKNFWSSRQKRLARILQTSPQPPKSQKSNRDAPIILHDVPSLEAPKFSSSSEEESSSKNQSFTSSYIDYNPKPIQMVPGPELVLSPNLCYIEQNLQLQLEYNTVEKKPWQDHQQSTQLTFPQLQTDVSLVLEGQELMNRFGEPSFFEEFATSSVSDVNNLELQYAPHFGTEGSCGNDAKKENDNPGTPDIFIDDFPIDMFDHIETLPSPSEW